MDIDAQPLVQATAALRTVLREYQQEIEREQRLPPALVEQLDAAGFYRIRTGMLARPARRRPDSHDRAGMVSDRRPGVSGDGYRVTVAVGGDLRRNRNGIAISTAAAARGDFANDEEMRVVTPGA